MLATQLQPSSYFTKSGHSHSDRDSATQYRPVKDAEAFKALLPAIEFVEGSSTGAFAVPEAKYQPINVGPTKRSRSRSRSSEPTAEITSITPGKTPLKRGTNTPASSSPSKGKAPSHPQLFMGSIDTAWPSSVSTVGAGLHNTGNTCFANSALQCLLHTPALLRVVYPHGTDSDPCRMKGNNCITCAFKTVVELSHSRRNAFTPAPIIQKLTVIAKHLRRGRQEDSHEFLRYLIDSLQKSCLAGHPPKLDPKVAETSWVHKIFGGRLRSRVKCRDCGHNSDTFDNMLDLSIDIYNIDGLKDALKKFTHVDVLKGADKYKCEKCKKPVVAEKQFTIHDAPAVLTVHLKRFSPLGRKIGHLVSYPEQLSLSPYMSSGQFGPSYAMYGVVSHAGSGPNSGHYYAHVKAADGRWYNMNDDMVSPVPKAPTALKSAYMLFYVRDKGQALQAVVAAGTSTTLAPSTPMLPRAVNKPSIVGSMKKRKAEDEENRPPAESSRVKRQAVGPLLPDGAFIGPKLPVSVAGDPQARALAEKIAVANGKQGGQAMAGSKTSKSAMKLVDYEDDSESGSDAGEVVSKEQQKENHAQSQDHAMADNVVSVSENLSSPPANDDALAEAAASMSSTYTAAQPSVSTSRTPAALPLLVPPMNFYNSDKKRKEAEEEEEDDINDGDDDGDDDGPPASAPVRPAARTSNGQEHRAPFSPRKKNKQFAAGNGNKRRHSQGAFSPYDRVKGSNNLHEQRSDNRKPFVKQTYGNRRRR